MPTRSVNPLAALVLIAAGALAGAAPCRIAATVETRPERRGGDTDDVCIWVHPTDPAASRIIAADKKNGALLAFDLAGRQVQELRDGEMNNVDIRYGFPLGDAHVALVTASDRTDDSIAIYAVDARGVLKNVAATAAHTLQAYGACMYRSPRTGDYYYFVNAKSGAMEQWLLRDDGHGRVAARRMERILRLGSQPEGCVADDELGRVYLGEEGKGIWRFDAEPDGSAEGTLVARAEGDDAHLVPDVEGLTIYHAADGAGYLIASSQGDSTYAVFRREGDNDYVGRFAIVDGPKIDGTQDSDGIDVVNLPLGDEFPDGLFVSHDGSNTGPGGKVNVKLVPWGVIAKACGLTVDTQGWDPRHVPPPARSDAPAP